MVTNKCRQHLQLAHQCARHLSPPVRLPVVTYQLVINTTNGDVLDYNSPTSPFTHTNQPAGSKNSTNTNLPPGYVTYTVMLEIQDDQLVDSWVDTKKAKPVATSQPITMPPRQTGVPGAGPASPRNPLNPKA